MSLMPISYKFFSSSVVNLKKSHKSYLTLTKSIFTPHLGTFIPHRNFRFEISKSSIPEIEKYLKNFKPKEQEDTPEIRSSWSIPPEGSNEEALMLELALQNYYFRINQLKLLNSSEKEPLKEKVIPQTVKKL